MFQEIDRSHRGRPTSFVVDAETLPSRRQRLEEAIDEARRGLLQQQHADGHWCGELEGDTILESEYVLCLYYLGLADDTKVRPIPASRSRPIC